MTGCGMGRDGAAAAAVVLEGWGHLVHIGRGSVWKQPWERREDGGRKARRPEQWTR